MADETANRQARPDVDAALAETAFASLARAGAPVVVAEGDPARVVHANRAALALFAVADCDGLTSRLFGANEAAGRRLSHLALYILPGAAARLERIAMCFDGAPETVTILCRRTPGANPLFVMAGLGLRAGLSRSQPAAPASAPFPQAVVVEPPAQAPVRPAPKSLGAVRANVNRRFPGLGQARFLWRTDAANIVTEITPPLAEIVGAGSADLVGREFGAAVGALGMESGELESALATRATFSRVDLDWPIEDSEAAAPVTLGALPAFGRAHDFEGWRGFGVIHLDALREIPARDPSGAATPIAPASAASPPENEPRGAAASPQETSPFSRLMGDYSGVVVPLRPAAPRPPQIEAPKFLAPESLAPAPEILAPAPEILAEPSPQAEPSGEEAASVLVALSPHERNAFREIARTLGARGSEQTGEPPVLPAVPAAVEPPQPSAAPVVPELAPAPAQAAATVEPHFPPGFADALAIGVIVARGETTLFANRAALDWLGHANLESFNAAGGFAGLSKGAPGLSSTPKRSLGLRGVTGETFDVDVASAPVLWDGAPADCLTLSRPSALALERRVAALETALRQREIEADETLAILGAASDGFILLNGEGVILGLNAPAEKLFGYERDQIAGETFAQLLARESQAAALDAFSKLKGGEAPAGLDVTGRARSGAAVPLNLRLGRLGKIGDKNSADKFCAVLRDMSQWKATEGALEEQRVQAQRDSQAKSEFLAKVSHEIRTPLNAILGFAEVIMDERFGPVGNERYKEYLRDIHASGGHVMSLVNDLLDLSKIEAGKMELEFAEVDANRVVAECVTLIQPQANRERVITRLALAPRLPAIVADERSLRQIVLNLLANAVRYNEPGGQVIISTALSDSGHAVLRVKDTGVGMSETDLRKAMEPFGQASSSRAAGGTGLGLPLTKALVDANHAGLNIRSRKNEGTLVEVTFPLAAPPANVLSAAGKAG